MCAAEAGNRLAGARQVVELAVLHRAPDLQIHPQRLLLQPLAERRVVCLLLRFVRLFGGLALGRDLGRPAEPASSTRP